MTRRCTGPCGRELPTDAEHFYRQHGGDGFTKRCRECVKAATRERQAAAARERRKAAPPPKRCAGPCGRELPADVEHFARDPLDRPRPRCRECELAAELARERPAPPTTKTCTGRCGRELPTERFYRHAQSRDGFAWRCRDCISADNRERRAAPGEAAAEAAERCAAAKDALAAAKGALNGPIAELAELGGGSASPIGPFSSREGRLSFIRRRVELAPPGHAAEAADRARRIMAAANRDVRELTRPPFDVREVFMDMAAASSDEGVQVLATALRGQGWAP